MSRFNGFAIMCLDHPEVQALVGRIEDRRIITYGTNPQADVQLINERADNGTMVFDVNLHRRAGKEERVIKDVCLNMPGHHNVLNAMAAIVVATELGIDDDTIRVGMKSFGGVKRRFTLTGKWNGVRIYDDYGHHPVEISAVLHAAREGTQGKVIAIVQPHRFTRLQSLFDEFCTCFNDADVAIVADVHAAGENPIEGIDRDALAQGIRANGHRNVLALSGPEDLAKLIAALAEPGDSVVFLGAGTITQWANALPDELAEISNGEPS